MFIDNINSIIEIFKSKRRVIEKIYIDKEKRGEKIGEIIAKAKEFGVPLHWVESSILKRICHKNKGVVAKIIPVEFYDPFEIMSSSRNPFLVILDSIEDPRNFGAIIRTCVSAGVDGIVIRKVRTVGITPSVYSSSAGMVEHIKIGRVPNIPRFLNDLKEREIWIVGAEKDGIDPWFSFDFKKPVAIVFGSEGKGISRLVREKCDVILSIPMKPQAHSLNISVAVGIFLFEVLRQREFKNG